MKQVNYHKILWLLILVSTLARAFVAAFIELGNDEVYYRLYALYSDWSHFDHPLMVGAVIQFFSLNLHYHSEFFLRLGSVILGAADIWLVFKIGKELKNERTGLLAALLFVGSLYASVIAGTFILPDAPQMFFWLISLLLMIRVLPVNYNEPKAGSRMLWMGFVIGLAILSKYTSVYLWGGAGLYILFFNRKWLRSPKLYMAIVITAITVLPIVVWNFQNDFISFTFHGDRVDMLGHSVRWDYLLTELAGEIAYNNPVNFLLIWIALFALFFNKLKIERSVAAVVVMAGLPLIVTFLVFSLFRSTLPHWTAPGYTTLTLLAAVWLDGHFVKRAIPLVVKVSVVLIGLVVVLGFIQINCGIIKIDSNSRYEDLGEDDVTLDMYGYDAIGNSFRAIVARDIKSGEMPEDAVLFGINWFPLANLDYYAASPIGMRVYGIGNLDRIHKYAWINRINGGFQYGMSGYYISVSRDFKAPEPYFKDYFAIIEPADTIHVVRCDDTVERAFVFRLKNMTHLPEDVLTKLKE